MAEDKAKYRYRAGEYGPNLTEQQRNLAADYADGKYTGHGSPVPPEILAAHERAALLEAGINQVADAMMDAEDRAEQTPNVPIVDVYRTDDTLLRVEVTVEDESNATGFDENDIRDANRPFIPVSWRRGSGVVSNLYPIEIHDSGGNLLGAWGARELQITYHFEEPKEATPQEMIRWIQARVDVVNEDLAAKGQPPIPVIGRDVCAACGVPLSDEGIPYTKPYATVDGINYCEEHLPQ